MSCLGKVEDGRSAKILEHFLQADFSNDTSVQLRDTARSSQLQEVKFASRHFSCRASTMSEVQIRGASEMGGLTHLGGRVLLTATTLLFGGFYFLL